MGQRPIGPDEPFTAGGIVTDQPTADTVPPPIDRVTLLDRCMGDAGFTCMILAKFQSQLGHLTAEVERATAAGDAAAAGRAAHTLKGASANLSAAALQAAAAAVEVAGHRANAAALPPLLPPLRAEVARVAAYLPTLMAELDAAPSCGIAA